MVMMDEKLVQMMVDTLVEETLDWTNEARIFGVGRVLKDPEIGGLLTGCEKLEVVIRVKKAWSGHQR